MKNLLLSFFFLLCIMPLRAQLTAEEIQGKWKLVTVTTNEATVDVATGKVTMDNGPKKVLGTVKSDQIKKEFEDASEGFKTEYLEVKGNTFAVFMDGKLREGSFKVTKDKKDAPVIIATFKDKTYSKVSFRMKDGKAMLKPADSERTYIYEKEL